METLALWTGSEPTSSAIKINRIPLLLNGTTGAVLLTIVLSILAIIAFVVCLERYFLTTLSWQETFLQAIAAVMLIWADRTVNYIGIALFLSLVIFQLFMKKKRPGRKHRFL
ncbi:MAG: hypothetical protein JRD84_08600 [Deltaproteobacteria bacterium]|nr:hypothetical protein [Deltaproteobacteria bacterium]